MENGWQILTSKGMVSYIPHFEQAAAGFVALTPHNINIQSQDGTPLMVLAGTRNAPRINQSLQTASRKGPGGANVSLQGVGDVVNMPEPREGVTYIVGVFMLNHPEIAGRADVIAVDSQRGVSRVGAEMWVSQFLATNDVVAVAQPTKTVKVTGLKNGGVQWETGDNAFSGVKHVTTLRPGLGDIFVGDEVEVVLAAESTEKSKIGNSLITTKNWEVVRVVSRATVGTVRSFTSQNGRVGVDVIAHPRHMGMSVIKGSATVKTVSNREIVTIDEAGDGYVVVVESDVESVKGGRVLASAFLQSKGCVSVLHVTEGAIWKVWGYKRRTSAMKKFEGGRVVPMQAHEYAQELTK